ncbi:MAG: hypothetical protein K8R57_03370 [Verrucomicrobia bacterium]|nr:hypothetical protein [Verrucomicrobiota bacterium]
MYSFPKQIIDSTLPTDARRILINLLNDTGEAKDTLYLLENIEAEMNRYASNHPLSNNQLDRPFQYESRCLEFEGFIREVLGLLGNRVNLKGFKPIPLQDPTIHANLAQACVDAGFFADHGYCDAVYVDTFGRATAHKSHVIRLSLDDIYADIRESETQFHVLRFIALNPKMTSGYKMRVFARMVKILLRTAFRVTGKPATSNDGCVLMDSSGDWRFIEEPSPYGEITRLERFWLRAGGIPERLFIPNSSYVVFLRDANALEVAREWRRQRPNEPSPYSLVSRFSHFAPASLEKLVFEPPKASCYPIEK